MIEYIEKEQAIETIKKVLPIIPHSCSKTNNYLRWISVLSEAWNDIPSADVHPVVHGHWELLYWAFDYYRCSECGFEQRLEEFSYCPNCGARMDGDGK